MNRRWVAAGLEALTGTEMPQHNPSRDHSQDVNGRFDLTAIKRSIFIRDLLLHLGWPIRHRSRADCQLPGPCIKARGHGSIAFNHEMWNCHRCNQGGDVITLWRLATGVSFISALKDLSAMAGVSAEPFNRERLRRERCERERRQAEAAAREEYLRRRRVEARDWLHFAEHIYAESSQRLSRLQQGAPEAFPGEIELHWEVLAFGLDTIREAEAEYRRLAGLENL